ncbi:NUDIX domain-containing protein [Variovorax sp. J22R133]|uniref:NUDIX hydrolase n=1 Tax=Variovorax brevis TaxID=3053503 RepID=UPI002574C137|nr:NUDIX domain-containing protein [Variovorax sp. J22R133]MDM0115876.1 NUDIX domain-containing protein [Variovorax sp. J22R133]
MRTAATLILLRDGSLGLEALLLRRAEKANDQNSGASVFPGGVVDAHDRRLHAMCSGMDDAAASARLSVAEGGLDFYAAAVRECFEEAGVLLARDATGGLVDLQQVAAPQLAAMREAAAQGTEALTALCEANGWRLAIDQLIYFSHWLTPPGMPRRFDTRFFVALMPPGQAVIPDGRETVEHMWLRPVDALDPDRALKLMNVTRRILEQLSTFPSASACMAYAGNLREITRVMPRLANGPEGSRAVNMEEPAYPEVAYVDPEGKGHARYALEPGLVMRLSPHVWRVTAADAASADAPGAHSYFVGGTDGPWALIDPLPHDAAHAAALRAAAPGDVRWILFTQGKEASTQACKDAWPDATVLQPQPNEELKLGDATLRVLSVQGDVDARHYLLVQERLLFAGTALQQAMAPRDDVAWIAPHQGFIVATRA